MGNSLPSVKQYPRTDVSVLDWKVEQQTALVLIILILVGACHKP